MNVNVKEGMRRAGLLLGVCGGLLGGFLAYGDAQNLWNARKAHYRFEALIASPTLRQVAKAVRDEQNGPWVKYRSEHTESAIGVDHDGIGKVMVDQAGLISSVELATGESVQRTAAPSLTAYCSLILYPLLGFMLPWGIVRVLTWIGSGFFAPHRPA